MRTKILEDWRQFKELLRSPNWSRLRWPTVYLAVYAGASYYCIFPGGLLNRQMARGEDITLELAIWVGAPGVLLLVNWALKAFTRWRK